MRMASGPGVLELVIYLEANKAQTPWFVSHDTIILLMHLCLLERRMKARNLRFLLFVVRTQPC
jgi:hypothetical protein